MPIIVCKCARNFNDNAEKRFDSSPFFLSRAISIWQWTDNAFPIKWLGLEKKKSPSLQRIDLILLGHLHTQWLYRARRIRFPSWIYWIVVITIVFVIDVIIATLTMSTWFPFCIFLSRLRHLLFDVCFGVMFPQICKVRKKVIRNR